MIVFDKMDSLIRNFLEEKRNDLINDILDVAVNQIQFLRFREGKKCFQELFVPIIFLRDPVQLFAFGVIFVHLLAKLLGGRFDPGEWVPQLMGNARRKFTQ